VVLDPKLFSALSVTHWWMYTVLECFLAAIVKLENTLETAYI